MFVANPLEAEAEAFVPAVAEPEVVAVIGESGVLVSTSAAASTLLGWSGEEFGRSRFVELVHPGDRAGVVAELRKLALGVPLVRFETQFQCRDGSYRPLSWSATRVASPAEGTFATYAAARDLTAAKGERESLLRAESAARAEAEAANRAKDEFLAVVSHELRTPLNAIKGWSHMLLSGRLTDDRRRHAVEVIARNASLQAQIIEDLLDISRITSGRLRLSVSGINPVEFVEMAIEAVRPAAAARNIRLDVTLDANVGTLMGDVERLQQVTWNLLANAVKFTPKGGSVHVRLQRRESNAEIRVEDTGEGISPEFMPYVFDRFRQAEAAFTRSKGGLGLGLAIVRHLVELHGGTIRATSGGAGLGSVFTVRLPLAAVHTAARGGPSVGGGAGGAGSSGSGAGRPTPSREAVAEPSSDVLDGIHVLVVDDEADACDLLSAVLGDRRARVSVATSAADGLHILIKERPDILVSDIGMPGEDGLSFLRRVRRLSEADGGRTPAIALTAYARPEDRKQALLAGFNMHVPKPIDPAELIIVVSSLMASFGPSSPRGPHSPG